MGDAVSTDRAQGSTGRWSRSAWLPWLGALVLAPLLLAALGLLWPRPAIEDDLAERASTALLAAGLDGATVAFDGRDATITGVPAGQESRALATVRGIDGVRVATVSGSVGSPAADGPGTVSALSLRLTGGRLVVSGAVPDEATRQAVLAAVTAEVGGPVAGSVAASVADELSVRPGTALAGDAATVGALAGALAVAPGADPPGGGERSVVWDGDGVTLTGAVADAAARVAAEQAVLAALPRATVDNQLTVAAPPPGPPPVDKAALQTALNALLAGAAISFQPDLPELTPQGAEAVRRAAELLRGAPGARVEIGGHVGIAPGGAENAQRLSDARAATVRDALVAAGVPAAGLVPRGYGDTRPKPDLAASRRVEITVL